MPIVHYTAEKFGSHWGAHLSGGHNIALSWNELIWAAMTMGKPGVAYLLSHGWHSISDLVVRSHTVYANLYEQSSHIEKSRLYVGLDPTEKSGVSYFMGMLAAKVLAGRLLDTPWLFHVSMTGGLGGAVALKGKSAPDLVGLRRQRDWIVAEAKGRSWRYSASAMRAAKMQTRQVRKVNGCFPALRVAIQASFNPRLEWVIEDPEEYEEKAIDLTFDVDDALERYYSASRMATDSGQGIEIGGQAYLARELTEIGVTVALDREVLQRLTKRTLSQSPEHSAPIPRVEPHQKGKFVIFSDGLAIAVDDRWSRDRMASDPWLRRGG